MSSRRPAMTRLRCEELRGGVLTRECEPATPRHDAPGPPLDMSADTQHSEHVGHSPVGRALAVLGTLVATAAVGVVVGPLGVLVAVGVGFARYLAAATTAFAAGQIVLVALYPTEGPLALLVLAEIGLSCVLLAPVVDHDEPGRATVATLVAGVALGGTAWAALRSTEGVWAGASVLVVGTAVVAYGLHRYERVRLGLVETP